MTDAISKSKVLNYLDGIVGENVVVGIMQKIQSGAFDITADADVKEIEKALAEATPGEWECKKGMTVCDVLSPSAKSYIARVTSERNARLIANAPTYIRALIAKLAEKDAEIERLREELIRSEEARGSMLISREQWEKDFREMRAEGERLYRQLSQAMEALEDIYHHSGTFGFVTTFEKSRQALQSIRGDAQ